MNVRSRLALTGLLGGLLLTATLLLSPLGQPAPRYMGWDAAEVERVLPACPTSVTTLGRLTSRRLGTWETIAGMAVGMPRWGSGETCAYSAIRAVKLSVVATLFGAFTGLAAARVAGSGMRRDPELVAG